jgi:hypothetical protein
VPGAEAPFGRAEDAGGDEPCDGGAPRARPECLFEPPVHGREDGLDPRALAGHHPGGGGEGSGPGRRLGEDDLLVGGRGATGDDEVGHEETRQAGVDGGAGADGQAPRLRVERDEGEFLDEKHQPMVGGGASGGGVGNAANAHKLPRIFTNR